MTKTLVDVDDELLAGVIEKSGASTKKQAINEALEFYLDAQTKGREAAWRDLHTMVKEGLIDLDKIEEDNQ